MRTVWIVGIGGFVGSVLRYVVAYQLSKSTASAFPYGTFAVNIVGCLLIGVFYSISERYQWLSPEWRIFLTTGLCGGFTTFSSFAYENVKLMESSDYGLLALYSVSSFVLGLLAVFIGIYIVKI